MQVIRSFSLETLHELIARPHTTIDQGSWPSLHQEETCWFQPWNGSGLWTECIEKGCDIWMTIVRTYTARVGVYAHNDVLFSIASIYSEQPAPLEAIELVRQELLAAHLYTAHIECYNALEIVTLNSLKLASSTAILGS
jgi:hypothetical protein